MINEQGYVELGLSCADICRALARGMDENELGETAVDKNSTRHRVFDCRTVAEIQQKIIKRREWNTVSQLPDTKNDKDGIAAWNLDLSRTLRVFNVRPLVSV